MKKRKAPGELELEILHLLYKEGESSVADLEKAFQGQYAYTTLLTVLSRMFAKKKITRRKEGRVHLYQAHAQAQGSLLLRIKKKLFGNKTAGMIQYLLESSDPLSQKELKEIEQLISRMKNE